MTLKTSVSSSGTYSRGKAYTISDTITISSGVTVTQSHWASDGTIDVTISAGCMNYTVDVSDIFSNIVAFTIGPSDLTVTLYITFGGSDSSMSVSKTFSASAIITGAIIVDSSSTSFTISVPSSVSYSKLSTGSFYSDGYVSDPTTRVIFEGYIVVYGEPV